MREQLNAARESLAAGLPCVFCNVVETRGSTPQKPGAVMVVFADGRQSGTLGGGCVEAEVRQKALGMMDAQSPQVFVYTLDDDYGWDDGLICGGRMTFVAQPLASGDARHYFEKLATFAAAGGGCTEAVAIDEAKSEFPVGTRFLFDAEGRWAGSLGAQEPSAAVRDALVDLAERPRPRTVGGVAYLPQLPRCRLLIVGAGHVGQAVAQLAAQAEFNVWVLDDRETFANKERFPDAQRILVGDIGRSLREFSSDENTYCLIVTRGHSHDEEALYHLAAKPSRYLGMIGSKRKIRMIFEDLEKEGIPLEALDRVYAPIGLDIGSQTVPEIAVSIVAQLIGHRNLGAEAFPPNSDRTARACSG